MRIKKSVFTAVLTLAITVSLAVGLIVGAGAAGTLQEIKAYLNSGVTVTLDGETQTFLDANGVRVFPITYNGSTYLPVRAVAGLAGLQVDWDQTTQTVKLGQAKGVDLIDTFKAYSTNRAEQFQSSDNKTEDISGETYSRWINMAVGFGQKTVASFNVGGKYSTLTFKCYSAEKDTTLQVLGDNDTVLAEIPLKGRQLAQTITVNLVGTSQLTFQIDAEKLGDYGDYRHVYIMDAHLN